MDDKTILEEFRSAATRHKAFEQLVVKYQQKLYWNIRRMVGDHDDTNDVLQDVFVKIYNSLEKFRSDARLYTWLYRIATNEALTFLKKQSRRAVVSMESDDYDLAESMPADVDMDGDEVSKKLQEAIFRLPDKQRSVFNMRYFDEMSYEEMSEATGTSVGALKASYHHAVKKIEKYILPN